MALTAGQRVGPYEVVAPIGSGGMGEVYRAHDARLRRDVAIKVLPDSFVADGDRLMRFEREAQVLAALNCPNIASIYGIEDTGGTRGLILELVEGPTLAERLADGPLQVSETLAIARQLVDALDAAHERGIVHRDLKPGNIKVTPDGVVKVLDFGLAKAPLEAGAAALSQSPTITSGGTRAGVLLGTAPYMSPEQARGRVVDKRTDIWAFGCVLYEMLTGRRAFAGDTVSDVIASVLNSSPDWSRLPSSTPPLVRRLLPRLLDAEPRRRVRDIADVRADLDESWSPAASVSSANPRWWRLVAAAAIAVIAIGVAAVAPSVVRSPIETPSIGTGVMSQLTSYGGRESSGAISPDGRSFVFVSEHGGTPDLWLRQIAGGDPVRLTDDAAIESDAVYAPDGESIYYTRTEAGVVSIWRILALGGQPRRVLTGGQLPAPSPDGRSLAWIRREGVGSGSMVISGIDGSNVRVLAPSLVPAFFRGSWSPDGRRLAYTSGSLFAPRNLHIVDVADGRVRPLTHFTESSSGPQTQAWLRDNRHLVMTYVATSRSQGIFDLGVIDADTGAVTRLTANLSESFLEPTLSQDGSRLILTSRRYEREVWKVPFGADPLANGRAATRLLDATVDPMWTYVTRDGRTLLYNNAVVGSRNLWVMPVDSSAPARQITEVPGDAVMHASLSPDRARVAFASSATGNAEIWVQNVDGSELRQLTRDSPANSWPAWSPDGRSIMYSAGTETWTVPVQGGEPEKVIDGFFRGDWIRNPDGAGTLIATSLNGGAGFRVIDVERRAVLWDQPTLGNGMPSFSPDGRWISYPYRESRDRDAIWVCETATGKSRVAVRFPEPFLMFFRDSWIDNGSAFLVNRYRELTHIVIMDGFWQPPAP